MSSNIENIAEQVGQLNKALENQYDILKALCADYISIYKIDFNTGKYEIYQTGNLHNKEIAEKLHISLTTVISHRKNITEKLGIKSASGLASYSVKHGYIDADSI